MQIKQIIGSEKYIDTEITVNGWITTHRKQKGIIFISLNDGSTVNCLQIVSTYTDQDKLDNADIITSLTKGASINVVGKIVNSPAKGQLVEMVTCLQKVTILGTVDTASYPMSKKRHGLEFVRKFPHLKMRTNIGAMVARMRNICSFSTHEFFQKENFINVHTPLITSNDCEGAGETFTVTTTHAASQSLIKKEDLISFNNDFFGTEAFLTVSGQLQAEAYACAMSRVYTFGPTFRAENSNTSRHLAEFWMVEPELCFIELYELMELAENYIKYCIKQVINRNMDDLKFIERFISKNHISYLKEILISPFKRLSYTEAINILMEDYNEDDPEYEKVEGWGIDMNSEQEKYLTSKFGPCIVYNYPSKIKSFYMKENDDGKTVQAMDILIPGIGEIIGGSMRENNYEKLKKKMKGKKLLSSGHLNWSLDLRRYGSVEHGGFGLGFERLIMFVTGLSNIKDCIPFPRYPKHCQN